MDGFTVKTDKQSAKLVKPSKGALTSKAQFVDFSVEQASASALAGLAITLVFRHVGNEAMVEACPAGRFGVEGRVGVEVAALDADTQSLDELEGSTQVILEVKGVVVVACYNASAGEMPVLARTKPLASLMGRTLLVLAFLRP